MEYTGGDLELVFCIVNEATRRNFQKLLQDLVSSGTLASQIPRYRFEPPHSVTQSEALDYLGQRAHQPEPRSIILLSDVLAEQVFDPSQSDSWTQTSWAKEVCDALGDHGQTIAIMDEPRRVRDVDRTIGRSATAQELLDTLKLVTDKLAYLARPEKITLSRTIEVRLIKKQHELMEYFKLRHRIYKIMGYLEEEIERAPSQMEINWCDTISLHCAAFDRMRAGQEELVGTARVVITSSSGAPTHAKLLGLYKEWTTKLARTDPVLRNALVNQPLVLELPIFHSQKLTEVYRQAVLRDEVCGELSRVIVAEGHRGGGLSSRLVKFALAEAENAGVQRMFLECLEIHESLYHRSGFKRIAVTPEAVISVNKTMIGMELYPLAVAVASNEQ